MNRTEQATAAFFDQAEKDDAADEAFGITAARAAYELQCRRMYVTAILEADPDLAF